MRQRLGRPAHQALAHVAGLSPAAGDRAFPGADLPLPPKAFAVGRAALLPSVDTTSGSPVSTGKLQEGRGKFTANIVVSILTEYCGLNSNGLARFRYYFIKHGCEKK